MLRPPRFIQTLGVGALKHQRLGHEAEASKESFENCNQERSASARGVGANEQSLASTRRAQDGKER